MLSDASYRGNDKDIFKLCHWVQHFCHWQELGRDSPAGLWFLLAAHTQPKVANKTQSKRCLTVDHRLLSCATSSLSPPADCVFLALNLTPVCPVLCLLSGLNCLIYGTPPPPGSCPNSPVFKTARSDGPEADVCVTKGKVCLSINGSRIVQKTWLGIFFI